MFAVNIYVKHQQSTLECTCEVLLILGARASVQMRVRLRAVAATGIPQPPSLSCAEFVSQLVRWSLFQQREYSELERSSPEHVAVLVKPKAKAKANPDANSNPNSKANETTCVRQVPWVGYVGFGFGYVGLVPSVWLPV